MSELVYRLDSYKDNIPDYVDGRFKLGDTRRYGARPDGWQEPIYLDQRFYFCGKMESEILPITHYNYLPGDENRYSVSENNKQLLELRKMIDEEIYYRKFMGITDK